MGESTSLLQKVNRFRHVPISLWPELVKQKGQRVAWEFYERWLEREPALAPLPTTPLRLFHSDALVPSFGERFSGLYPDIAQSLITHADQILDLRWTILGSELHDLRSFTKAGLIPWHTDIRSGKSWPATTFYADIVYGDRPNVDVKIPWEMSRGQNLLVLGQAYRIKKDERYAQAFVAQIGDWINQNPFGRGVNWTSAMEVAIRACNWCVALELFQDSPTLIDSIKSLINSSLFRHGEFIRRHFEWNAVVSSNHYLCDLLGEAYLGIFLRKEEWVSHAVSEMTKEIRNQLDDRGWDYEGSTAYHRFALEIFFFFSLVMTRAKVPLDPVFSERLKMMADRLSEIKGGDGRFPLVGDNDSGRIHPLARRSDAECAPWPSMVATLFDGGDKQKERPSELAWLFGFESKIVSGVKPSNYELSMEPSPSLFALKGAQDTLVFCAFPNGTRGLGNHGHNDKLSFTLEVLGDHFLVDPGTAAYTGDPALRNLLRSTAAHSTVEVDHREQNDFPKVGLFSLEDQAKVAIDEWIPGRRIQAHHTGYRKLKDPVVHHRTIERFDEPLKWSVVDQLTGQSQHTLRWTFIIGPGIAIETVSPTEFALLGKSGFLKMKVNSPRFTLSIEDIPIAPAYGRTLISKAIKISAVQELPANMKFEFFWKGRP